jgi:hypothetical protein
MPRLAFIVKRYPVPVVLVTLHTALMIWNELPPGSIKDPNPPPGTGLRFLCNFADIPTQIVWIFLPNPVFAWFPGLSFIWICGTFQWLAIGCFIQFNINRRHAPPRESHPAEDRHGPRASGPCRDMGIFEPAAKEEIREQPRQVPPEVQGAIQSRKTRM